MVVFKVKDIADNRYVEINFCKDGLYVEIGDCDGGLESNFVIDKNELDDLIEYLTVC